MKKNPFKTAFSLLFGVAVFLLTGLIAFADVTSSSFAADAVPISPIRAGAGLILILGLVGVVLAGVAVIILLSIRKKNAK